MMSDELIHQTIKELVEEKWTPGIIAVSGTTDKEFIYSYGYTDDYNSHPVDKYTLIDLASVTKIFTLFLTLYMRERKMIDLEKSISHYSSKFKNIEKIKIYELMNFSKVLVTPERLDVQSDPTKTKELIYYVSINENNIKYSDIGSIVLSTLIDDIYGEDSFRNEMKSLWNKAGLERTYWWDEIGNDDNIYNYNNEYRYVNDKLITIATPKGVVHDKKARNIGACGHSGIFSCAEDICKFTKWLLTSNAISLDTISLLTSNKYDSVDSDGRHFGLLCFKKTYNKYNEIPSNSSDNSIAISGYTGTYYAIDFEKKRFYFIGSDRIHNNLTTKEAEQVNNQPYKRNTQSYAFKKDNLRDLLYLEIANNELDMPDYFKDFYKKNK